MSVAPDLRLQPFSRLWLRPEQGVWPSLAVNALALLPLLLLALWQGGMAALLRLLLGAALGLAWQAAFARLRGRPLLPDAGLTVAGALLLLGPDIPLGQFLIAISFAIVLGEQVFGGRGRYLLNPVVLAVGFQVFAYGPLPAPALSGLALAAALGALLLLFQGLISWRLLLAASAGWLLVCVVRQEWLLPGWNDPFWFAVLFLLTDPVAGAATRPGRIAHGLLAGLLLALPMPGYGEPAPLAALAFALMLAALFAPLLDRCALWWMVRRERRRQNDD
ncbi:RnfABCDGE type electron transport complex subunit D [Pseudomarimonas arenosa]|uniref:RnfABCDGE type electron transport complex subunit D n=1 Tax=Pseudomarimonas arenosa TaxID=2774145 RepID=A0AAW3ZPA9_9GAMM|nr:RnfABCDGE type electron transport complex subunit D [Pseudomarimonas arenosa]MBD8526116.1 RnfABCDGE type electron transport complex subunit D [Pseudomarimonas arenosa]